MNNSTLLLEPELLTLKGFLSQEARREWRASATFKSWEQEWSASKSGHVNLVGRVSEAIKEANPATLQEWESYYIRPVQSYQMLKASVKRFRAWTLPCRLSSSPQSGSHLHSSCSREARGVCVHEQAGDRTLTRREAWTHVFIHILDKTFESYRSEYQILMMLREYEAETGLKYAFATSEEDWEQGVDIVASDALTGDVTQGFQVKPRSWEWYVANNPEAEQAVKIEKQKMDLFRKLHPLATVFYISEACISKGFIQMKPAP